METNNVKIQDVKPGQIFIDYVDGQHIKLIRASNGLRLLYYGMPAAAAFQIDSGEVMYYDPDISVAVPIPGTAFDLIQE